MQSSPSRNWPDGDSPLAESPVGEGKNWYALYTRARHEKQVALFLTKSGIECYLPVRRIKKKWSDRMKMVEEPLFKGYLFVHMEFRRDRLDVLRQKGSVHIVTFEGQPAVVPDDTIAALRLLEEKALSMETAPALAFQPGDQVTITQGPFKGLHARVEKLKNTTRIVIVLPMLNQLVSAEVDPWDLEKA